MSYGSDVLNIFFPITSGFQSGGQCSLHTPNPLVGVFGEIFDCHNDGREAPLSFSL